MSPAIPRPLRPARTMRPYNLTIATPMKIGAVIRRRVDGTYDWWLLDGSSPHSTGFASRADAANDLGLYCGERYLWPVILDTDDADGADDVTV